MKRPASTAWLVALLLVAGAVPVLAAAPATLSYQGVLTDNDGTLVADGSYDYTFRIYDVATAGVALWSETQSGIPVTKGGFAVILGAVNPIALAFDRQLYLGITVNAGTELAPRVVLAGAPHALGLRLPFTAFEASGLPLLHLRNTGPGPAIVASPLLDLGTGGTTGTARWFRGGTSLATVEATGSGFFQNGGQLLLRDDAGNDILQAYRYGSGQGGLSVASDPFFVRGFAMRSKPDASGDPEFLMLGSGGTVYMDGGQSGDAAVQLPSNAIGSLEQFDEPGIAQGHKNVHFLTTAGMTDIASVTIDIPAPGYIVVEADGELGLGSNGSAASGGYIQISEVSNGPMVPNFFQVGSTNLLMELRFPISKRTTFYKATAGSYTFHFQGWAFTSAVPPGIVWKPTITAQYFPTSYGTVSTSVSEPEAGRFTQARREPLPANLSRPMVEGAIVDLRELELREARQTAALEKTRRELAEMRVRGIPASAPAPAPVKQ